MQQSRTGWWTLGAFAGLTLLGLYVAAYYAAVQPGLNLGSRRQISLTLQYEPHYGRLGSAGKYIFRPMFLADRWLRPGFWSEEVHDFPDLPRKAAKSAGE